MNTKQTSLHSTLAGKFFGATTRGRERVGGLIPFEPRCLQQVQGAGYDALIQSSSWAMKSVLLRDLRQHGAEFGADRSLDGLTSTQREAVETAVATEVADAPIIAWPISPRRARVEFEAHHLRLRLGLSRVDVSSGADPQVTITFSAELLASAVETAESYETRVDRRSFRDAPPPFRDRLPVGADPVHAEISLATMVVRARGLVGLSVDAPRFRADARFLFRDAEVDVSGVELWASLVDEEAGRLLSSWGDRAIAAPAQFFGEAPATPVPGISRFEAIAIGTNPLLRPESWLTLCFSMTPGDTGAGTTPIEPFTGTHSLGVFMAEPVIVATILSRWPTIPRPSVELIVPIRLFGDGEVRYASARIRYQVGPAAWAGLSYGTEDVPDNIRVFAEVVSRAIAAEFEGEDVSDELGANPTVNNELFRVFAGTSGVEQNFAELDAWLLRIGRHVMAPALRPLASPWRLRDDFQADLSAPLSSLICRGDLT